MKQMDFNKEVSDLMIFSIFVWIDFFFFQKVFYAYSHTFFC